MNKKKIKAWVLLIIWMLVIFFFSSQPGNISSNLSNSFVKNIIKIIPLDLDICSFIIRKFAHLSEYFILALLMYKILDKEKINKKVLLKIWLLCILYAISDEIHQLFVLNRSAKVTDVLIDSLGSFLGLLVSFKVYKPTK